MHSVNSFRNFLGLASPYETLKILPVNTGLVKSLFFWSVEILSLQIYSFQRILFCECVLIFSLALSLDSA